MRKENMEEYFLEIDHTADLAIQVKARTFLALIQQAVQGMLHLMGIEDKPLGREISCTVSFSYTCLEDILVQAMNEILYELEASNLLYIPAELTFCETQARIFYIGVPCVKSYHEIKAVTYHQMEIVQDETGFQSIIVFDV